MSMLGVYLDTISMLGVYLDTISMLARGQFEPLQRINLPQFIFIDRILFLKIEALKIMHNSKCSYLFKPIVN